MASNRDTELNNSLDDEYGAYFDPKLPDDKFVEQLKKEVDESRTYWFDDKKRGLRKIRESNVKLWLPDHYDGIDLYDHQSEYIDPRVFISVETIVSIVAGRLPQPEAFPASESVTSVNLAKDLQKGLHIWAQKHNVLDLIRMAIRDTLLKRGGLLKLRWDKDFGKHGDIVPEFLDPDEIIVDKRAKKGENPRFIAHIQKKTVEEWIAMFPFAKKKILEACSISRGVSSQLAKRVECYEIWFTAFVDNKRQEFTAWTIDNKVIHRQRHADWIYEDEQLSDTDLNILDYPEKPFFVINHLNLGQHWFDDTTLVEQAESLQRTLEKRGRQIVQNADDASGGLVLNSQMIDKDDAGELSGDPQEKIMVDGDVRMAAGRIAPAMLPAYVLQDKFDARQEIDNVFATHVALRGEQSNSATLGQDVLQHNQDMTRHDDIVRSIELMATRLYRYVVQMMKVHYKEEHLLRMAGKDGTFDFIALKNDKIEDGIDVIVKAGSTLPVDRTSMRAQILQLAQQGLVDPLTIYETLQIPDPQAKVERLTKWMEDKAGFVKDYQQDEYEREAFSNITLINNGYPAREVDEPSQGYVDYYRKYMMSGEFLSKPTEIQQGHANHLREIGEKLQQILALQETQLPTPEEMTAGNEQAVTEEQQIQAMMGGNGGQMAKPVAPVQAPPAMPTV